MRRTAALVLVLALAACAGSPSPTARPAADDAVVVASFDFPESVLLGEIYALALEERGVHVRRELGLGPRELVLPALRAGLVDVVPEYLGTVLATVDAQAPPGRDESSALAELRAALRPDRLQALQPARAQNTNGLAVTRSTAERLGLRTTSDLRAHASELTLAGPAECPHRPYCLPGLAERYGITFRSFAAYPTESQRITALDQGVVDVAVVFTTDGVLAERRLVLLTDDRHLQPDEQLVPVVSDRALRLAGPAVRTTLDAVSAQLDSAGLRFLNWRVSVAGRQLPAEALGWLQRHGLVGHDAPA
jgi:osmoprotectant transport system substrate-binding protein